MCSQALQSILDVSSPAAFELPIFLQSNNASFTCIAISSHSTCEGLQKRFRPGMTSAQLGLLSAEQASMPIL